MKVADGFEPGAVIGPLIDMKAVEKVEAHIADAVEGRQGRHRQQARRCPSTQVGRQLLRADRADRCDDRHGHHQGGEETFGPLYRFEKSGIGRLGPLA
jgi:acyl-CoA reductase-like NAD-dependent aldehyde dehydrogenase